MGLKLPACTQQTPLNSTEKKNLKAKQLPAMLYFKGRMTSIDFQVERLLQLLSLKNTHSYFWEGKWEALSLSQQPQLRTRYIILPLIRLILMVDTPIAYLLEEVPILF